MSTIKDRILEFIDYKGITKNKFESKCGLASRYVSNIGRAIQSDVIEKIILTYPEINLEWLVLGKGEMLMDDKKQPRDYQTREELPKELKEDLAIYRKMVVNFNDIVERQNRRLDELEAEVKNSKDANLNPNLSENMELMFNK